MNKIENWDEVVLYSLFETPKLVQLIKIMFNKGEANKRVFVMFLSGKLDLRGFSLFLMTGLKGRNKLLEK